MQSNASQSSGQPANEEPSKGDILPQGAPIPLEPDRPAVPPPHENSTQTITDDSPDEPEQSTFTFQGFLIVVIMVALLAGCVVWGIGRWERTGTIPIPQFGSVPTAAPGLLVESRNGLVLMLEKDGENHRVIIQQSGNSSWLLVSRGDLTADHPSLSPVGTSVAYYSKRDDGQIRVVSILSDTEKLIDARSVALVGKKGNLGEVKICPWTFIAWSPSGNRIAFFTCRAQPASSAALVADLSGRNTDLKIADNSLAETNATRQIAWQDDAHLFFTVPMTGTSSSAMTLTVEVP